MDISEIFNLFLIISAIHGFAFSIFLFKRDNHKERGIYYLNLMILVIALNNMQSWLLAEQFIVMKYIQIPWHFLVAPLFYTFLINYLNIKKHLTNILKYIVPLFLISIVFQVVCLAFQKDNSTLHEYQLFYEKYTAFEELFSLLISISIFIFSFSLIKNKKELFNDVLSFDNLKWLNTFIFLGGITYGFWIIAIAVKFYLNFTGFIIFYYPLRIMTTILIYWLGYELVYILRQVKERKAIREKGLIKQEKVLHNNSKKFNHIETYILDNRRFLDNLLSLETLATELQMSSSQLSKLINEQSDQNFNYLINGYRIAYSKELLLDENYANYTITSIALESGFNSKSTFYYAFKKHTGITPTEFKKNIHKQLS
ncbi:helix-turn-helix domain-containing protein [Tenacibaculum amylolyticum]|uniref:helix-turn-helix domain-containing protein n=1 Tax=Tenacibaculum amylolyticum TaxID=104269 RepID=UPI0038933432